MKAFLASLIAASAFAESVYTLIDEGMEMLSYDFEGGEKTAFEWSG
jgi:hypothetical protein